MLRDTSGVCGLVNLGNTHFMNSMLQCLNAVVLLRKYFTEGDFERELNVRLGRRPAPSVFAVAAAVCTRNMHMHVHVSVSVFM